MKFRRLLWPLSLAYGAGQRIDRLAKLSGAYRSRLPVISIGNLSVGGSGKTPLALYLVERLQREYGILVLTRGYRRESAGTVLWRAGESLPDYQSVGDEPALIAMHLKRGAMGVASDRASLLRSIEGEFTGHIVLLDDGFQHYRMARDLDIVIVDDRTVENAGLLPAGDLREPPSALRRAHIILATSTRAKEFAYRWRSESAMVLGMRTYLKAIVRWNDGRRYDGNAALLVTGIARSERVPAGLGEQGRAVVGHLRYPDHHQYSRSDVAHMLAEMRRSGGEIILTTAKDAVKLSTFGELAELLYVIEIDIIIDREDRMFEAIESVVTGGFTYNL